MRIRRILSVAGFLGVIMGVSFGFLSAATTSWASGVSVSSEVQAIANEADSYPYPLAFDASVQTALLKLQVSDGSATNVASTFYDSYVSATGEYRTALRSASDIYSENKAPDSTASKNMYLDNFASARKDYFGKLEAARNTLVSELYGKNDGAKDAFVKEFNSALVVYNNQLESVKSSIAAL